MSGKKENGGERRRTSDGALAFLVIACFASTLFDALHQAFSNFVVALLPFLLYLFSFLLEGSMGTLEGVFLLELELGQLRGALEGQRVERHLVEREILRSRCKNERIGVEGSY